MQEKWKRPIPQNARARVFGGGQATAKGARLASAEPRARTRWCSEQIAERDPAYPSNHN